MNNGDSYSSRGMAPSSSSAKPRQQDGSTTDKRASTDTDRHGSSRDYPVSTLSADLYQTLIYCSVMIDAVIEEIVIEDAPVPQAIEVHDLLVVMVM